MTSVRPWLATILLLLLVALDARAHAVDATCKLRNGRVEVEAYFDDDTPAADAKVVLRDADGAVAAEGRTDRDGRWSCPAPPVGTYEVVVDAGAGHRARQSLTVAGAVSAAAPPARPSREEFTRFRWPQMLLGLAVIAGLAAGVRFWMRRRPAAERT